MRETGRSDSRIDRAQRVTLFALIVLLCLASNAHRGLVQPDEGRYAEIPREMLVSGDWIVPHLNGLSYVEKPPLQYWATAAAYRVFGTYAWVSRLWNLVLGLAGIAVVFATGRKLWGPRAGEFAALVLLSTPLYILVGQLNLLDMGLTFFLTGALCAFLLAQRADADPASTRHYMWLCWASVGFGFLQKGLVAFAVPFLVLVAYSLLQRDGAIWRRLHLLAGIVIVGALSLPWLVALGLRDTAYAQYFLIHEHFTRFLTTEHHRDEAWWYFLAILAAGALPWIGLMLRATAEALRREATPAFNAAAALALWALLVVAFFSLSGSKLAPYIMPCLPPLALLAGKRLAQQQRRSDFALVLATGAVLACLLLIARTVTDARMTPGPAKDAYLAVGAWAQAAGAVAALAVVIALWALRRGRTRLAMLCFGLGTHVTWMVFLGGANIMADHRGAPGAAALMRPHVARGEAFYCVGAYLQSLSFDLERTCTLVEYTGELEIQFERDRGKGPLSFEQFADAWRSGATGVALVHKDFLPRMASAGLGSKIVARYPDFDIVEHP